MRNISGGVMLSKRKKDKSKMLVFNCTQERKGLPVEALQMDEEAQLYAEWHLSSWSSLLSTETRLWPP
jgi:hypothetical protein